ncbi:hypothetical protein [Streptomyces sp. NPDC001750]|uniref:hypothetical protein n=1 Tax=Streptomyces sp. NPDC001750 TaxID=3364607 RepID=UPI0036C7C3B9
MKCAALDDAQTIAKGIRLGGSTKIVTALEAALTEGPLTPDRIERLAHPDWDRVQFEVQGSELLSEHGEPVGLACLYGPAQGGWAVAASWYGLGWLAGIYASREAALLAYGYVLGGEGRGGLEELRDQVFHGERRPITPADLVAFAER